MPSHASEAEDAASRHVYATGGVHNDKDCDPPESCVYRRGAGEPTDPAYPAWWTSGWTMYRVFNNFDAFPPPYANPPAGLTPGDYEVSYGTSYYDSTYVPADKDGTGAMMEYYDKRCLPIFPFDNKFSCAFVSLGNKAYFLRYADRPPETPQCCQFSLKNHPPRVDFIKHLPYNAAESRHVGDSLQAYSYRVGGKLNILFGYAFDKAATPDAVDTAAAPYRHPQSFYFSGVPTDPPNAPIVSQNYTNFRMQRPDPEATWAQVARMCPAQPEWCCLFSTDCPGRKLTQSTRPPQWTDFTTPPRMPASPEEKKP
ncbi:hypothetical protein [Methylobacterium sp. SyP6R]|uniref:hypothetical protein n=1 Tax=Methylobacterium sp. SyP6R TaxID=2718876 RepID=UPI001F28D0BC|nr:hypothetical protein [Methylobacterium sp. SyP6R]MCF4129925.1 hypothetical protein [Methylobacterium sp. SyP6R]